MLKEILGDTFNVISHAAPIMVSALINPAAGIATKFAIAAVSHALNLSSTDPKELATAIQNTPNIQEIFSELESRFGGLINNINNLKMPTNIEINLKLNWN